MEARLRAARIDAKHDAMSGKPGFFERIGLALRVLGDADLAERVRDGTLAPAAAAALPAKVEEKVVEKIVERVVEKSDSAEGALHLLSILQRDGRLIDFVNEDLSGAGDGDVGAAARIVHAGCKKALSSYFTFAPIRTEAEGATVNVDKGFDPAQIRLAGNVKGEPPFKGTLTHPGWKAVEVRMPERTGAVDGKIVAPAEVELR
jgi:hypothetical protein